MFSFVKFALPQFTVNMILSFVWCFVLISVSASLPAEKTVLNGLPDCSENNVSDYRGSVVFVSTLDGRVTALNARAGGMMMWSIDTGPGPLLSSSIHKLELTSNGHWVRMIPSLSGGLYKFNGANIEMLPVSADHLLQSSSFLLTDGLVISGGRETRIYSISMDSGELLYECSMNGCDNFKNTSDNAVVIERYTQTVRAIDIHSGSERWNFSVGEHHMKVWSNAAGCHLKNEGINGQDFDIDAIIPEGLVYAVEKTQHNQILWKHKFSSPVVSVWRLDNGNMYDVNVFNENKWSTFVKDSENSGPVLYLGMHQKQLYIQECKLLENAVKRSRHLLENEYMKNLQIPWEPFPVTSTALGLISRPSKDEVINDDEDIPITALSVLYASEYVNGNGYYLFNKNTNIFNGSKHCTMGNKTNTSEVINDDEFENTQETSINVIIFSAWCWWGEVLVISVITAVVVNLLVTQQVLHLLQMGFRESGRKEIVFVEKPLQSETNVSGENSKNSGSSQLQSCAFTSRFAMDFDTVQCLGKGGFGVVFEAKNKIDDRHYAIKRIALPSSLESRDRVLREVKVLAKLEHQHIVRYFNAWLECPPSGWRHLDSVHFEELETESGIPNSDIVKAQSTGVKSRLHYRDETSLMFREKNLNVGLKNTKIGRNSCDVNDSFIVFENSHPTNMDNEDEMIHSNFDALGTDSYSRSTSFSKKYAMSNSHYRDKHSEEYCVSDSSDYEMGKSPTRMYLYIQMQLCLKESLREWLCENVTNRDKKKLLQMFEQIVRAVEYIHREGLLHRDLKPSNIFFSSNGQIKVGDFGLVTTMTSNVSGDLCGTEITADVDEKHTAQVGTQLYMSPEQVKGLPYDYKVDIYSLGVIFFELLHPFSTQMERHNLLLALRHNNFPELFKVDFQDEYELLCLMLAHNPDNRPTTFGILARPPLSDISGVKNIEPDLHFTLPPHSHISSN